MKTAFVIRSLGILVGLAIGFGEVHAQVRVRGYLRKDGTYVAPHVRTNPDRIPTNNWSYPGNVNPYTGEVASGDPVAYLERYYQVGVGTSNTAVNWSAETAEAEFAKLTPLPDEVPQEEIRRSTAHCSRLSSGSGPQLAQCMRRQSFALASLALPDYRSVPAGELARSGAYCERLYNDDRAGFYNCLNRQVLGLSGSTPNFAEASAEDEKRSTRYCSRLYGDDRAGFHACLMRQSTALARNVTPKALDGVAIEEWERSIRYCERLYGDDRGGYTTCVNRQETGLRAALHSGSLGLPVDEWARAQRYCERLYGDDRAGNASCQLRQSRGIPTRPPARIGVAADNCERLYADDRAGYWACLVRKQ